MRGDVALAPLPPREAIEYFRSKGLAPPKRRFDYRDWWREEHARGFVVAKGMSDDILRTIRARLDEALAQGHTLERFRADLTPELQARGWWGRDRVYDELTGEWKDVQLGSARRLRVIFDTNMRTSLAAGRWARIQRTKRAFPYLEYRQIDRPTKREDHTRFHGLIRPVDDPVWLRIFPPNGWFCACSVRQMNDRMLAREGKEVTPEDAFDLDELPWSNPRTGEIEQLPDGIHPGFDTNPGAVWLDQRAAHRGSSLDLPDDFLTVDRTLVRETRLRGQRSGDETLVAYDLDADPGSGLLPGNVSGNGPEIGWSRSVGDFDPDWSGEGQPPWAQVGFTPAMSAALRDPGRRIVMIHNHPSSGSFSPADMRALGSAPGMAQIVAAGLDGSIYRAARTERTFLLAQHDPADLFFRLRDEIVRAMLVGDITRVDANAIHAHLFMEVLTRLGLLRYSASPSARMVDALARTAELRESILERFG